jgi:hypothetical protein
MRVGKDLLNTPVVRAVSPTPPIYWVVSGDYQRHTARKAQTSHTHDMSTSTSVNFEIETKSTQSCVHDIA